MIFQRYVAEGLAHYSYLIGDQGEAVVIDPRRDIDVYLRDAEKNGYHIGLVLETHRNEDYLIGSCEIESATGAALFHADGDLPYKYGQAVSDGDSWTVGRLRLTAIHTPGHTLGSMSYLLCDPDGNSWMIFTGDVLFSGDVGRVDLVAADRKEEMAGLLYDSIFERILPLGDSLIVCPAHGAGSVCGSGIAERVWTTIGLEKQLNPKLQLTSKETFVAETAKILERPPYFRRMEVLNLEGPPVVERLPLLKPLRPRAFEVVAEESFVLDTRSLLAFGGGHIPGSQFIWAGRLPMFAGWFLDYDQPLVLVGDDDVAETVLRYLTRMGFDNFSGYLNGGVQAWAMAGKRLSRIKIIDVPQFCGVVKKDLSIFILDVRGEAELDEEAPGHPVWISLTELPEHCNEIPKNESVFIVCRSGVRSMIAASFLERHGWENLVVPIGGLGGWRNYHCQAEL